MWYHPFARTRGGPPSKIPKSLFIPMLIIAIALACYSCAPKSAVIQPQEKNVFRSEDYIVYRLQENETAAELAETFLGERRKSWRLTP